MVLSTCPLQMFLISPSSVGGWGCGGGWEWWGGAMETTVLNNNKLKNKNNKSNEM